MIVPDSESLERIQSTAETRRDGIKRTASHLFESVGYSATTMNDIGEAVGLLPGSLYHHFESKEDIAVDLLAALSADLNELARRFCRMSAHDAEEPERRLRTLTLEVMRLSFKHAGAVRLRSQGAPPSISTPRFAEAIQSRSPTLDRAWKAAVDTVSLASSFDTSVDVGILRFTLQRMSLYASIYYPSTVGPERASTHLCDLMLAGLATEPPLDTTLDQSAALRAVGAMITAWRSRPEPGSQGDREDIVAVARAEFANRGYEAATVRDIANASGVRMATLYRRFESKEALLGVIVEEYAARFDELFHVVMTAGSSEPETMDALARAFVYLSRHHFEAQRIIGLGSRARRGSGPLAEYAAAANHRLSELESMIGQGVASGRLRWRSDAHEAAIHFRSLMWQPFHEYARTSEPRAHRFLRQTVLRGALLDP